MSTKSVPEGRLGKRGVTSHPADLILPEGKRSRSSTPSASPNHEESKKIGTSDATKADPRIKIAEAKDFSDMPPDIRYVLEQIEKLLHKKYDDIKDAMGQKGGWEVWLQVELAREIKKDLAKREANKKATYEIVREKLAYVGPGQTQKVDLWISRTTVAATAVKPQSHVTIVELKVAYASMDESGNAHQQFVKDRMQADMKKINANFVGNSWRAICVGVTAYQEDLFGDWDGNDGVYDNKEIHYKHIKDKKDVGGLVMIWAKGADSDDKTQRVAPKAPTSKKSKSMALHGKVGQTFGNRNGSLKL